MLNPWEGRAPHHHYHVYGQSLCSTIALQELPVANFEIRDIQFVDDSRTDRWLSVEALELIDRRPTNLGCDISVHRTGQGFLLEWENLCRFHISADGSEIVSGASADAGYGWVTATLYGMVLSFALHLKGVHSLHASAVTLEDSAVGFLADPGSGKSSLAAAFAAGGNPFLTDDVLALRGTTDGCLAFPGFPYASLSPQVAELFNRANRKTLPLNAGKSRVAIDGTWASFAQEPVNLQGLFSLDRSFEVRDVCVRRLSKIEAIKCLMENTNVLPLLPVELKQSQLAFATRLASTVPVYRLTYPTGMQHLPEVIREVTSLVSSQAVRA